MADDKPSKSAAKKAGAKKAKSKPASKGTAGKSTAKKSKAKSKAKKPAAKTGARTSAKKTSRAKPKKAAPKKAATSAAGKASSRPTVGLDKSIAQFRDSLEHSVTLSLDRLQEVVDDTVKRGRMTRGDSEKMIGEMVARGRKQTDALLGELEKLARAARRKLP